MKKPQSMDSSVDTTNPMLDDIDNAHPPPKPLYNDDGRRNSRDMKRRRPRRSLLRLTSFPLTEVEKKSLPPVPYNERKMTDVLFLLLFMVYWIGMIAVGSIGFKYGNPASLIYGRDSEGRICGDENAGYTVDDPKFAGLNVNTDMRDKRYVLFPRSEKDLQFNKAGFEINLNPLDIDFYRVCVSECPQDGDLVCTEEVDALIAAYMSDNPGDTRTRDEIIAACVDDPDVRLNNAPTPDCIDNVLGTQCFHTFFNHSSFLFRCFPEFVYKVENIKSETKCLETQQIAVVSGRIVDDCVKFQEVSKVTRVEPPDTSIVFEAFNTVSRLFDRFMGDVVKAYRVIIGTGIGVAGCTGLLYMMALRYFIGGVIWGTILFAIAVMVALTLFCYLKAGIVSGDSLSALSDRVNTFLAGAKDLNPFNNEYEGAAGNGTEILDSGNDLPGFISKSDRFADEFKYTGYVVTVLTLLLILIVVLSMERINKAIEFFKEASRCIRANPLLVLMPPITIAFMVLLIAYYISASLYITSAGSIDNGTLTAEFLNSINVTNPNEILNTKVFGPFEYSSLLNVYLFIGFLWSMAFIHGVALMTTSGVVAKWYWSGSPSNRHLAAKSHFTIFYSFYMMSRFHLGTAAFGSLLISFVQLVRYIASFIQARLNKTKNSNTCFRLLFWSLGCCLKCAENCVKFISHNAYIMVVLYGTSFCVSTKMAFAAFAHNLIQVATVTFLGDIILRFGQIFIVAVSVFVAYVTIDGSREFQIGGEKELNSQLFPVFITAVLAYFVAKEVLAIYHVAIDTILLSYCQDKKLLRQRGFQRDVKADNNMQTFVNKYQQEESTFQEQRSLEVYA